MVFKEAIICHLSEYGYKGFQYPSVAKGIIKQNSEYEVLSWLSGSEPNLRAIKIKKKNILPLTLDSQTVKILLSEQKEIVVWIFKTDISKEKQCQRT
jgi:hypothetical protein